MQDVEPVARALHDVCCNFPWESASEPHRDAWRERAATALGHTTLRASARRVLPGAIDAVNRIDHLDHELNDGRKINGKIVLGGTAIQDECQALRVALREVLAAATA